MRKQQKPWEQQFATVITEKSYGGLLICDVSREVDDGVTGLFNRTEHAPAPYFSHTSNPGFYQSTLINWFKFWGYFLSPQAPSELDLAISQFRTYSLYIDSRHWISALRTLTDAVEYLDISGVIFTSSQPFSRFTQRPKYPKVVNGLLFDKSTRWTEVSSGKLNLQFAECNGIKLVNCAHPRDEIPYSHIAQSANVMNEWLGSVLGRYRIKQTGHKMMDLFHVRQSMLKKAWPHPLRITNNKLSHV